MHEEAHLTQKEKKKKEKDEKGGWEGGRVEGWEDCSCAPAYELV